MKILCIGKPTEAVRSLSPDVTLQFLESTLQAVTKQHEEGRVLELYVSPIGCTVVILNYDSADEWVKDQRNVPGINYYEWEAYPLADGFESLRGMIGTLKAMKA